MRAFFAMLALTSFTPALASEEKARPNFDFVFETGWGTKIDTYHAIVTKDLVMIPDTTVACVLSNADLDSVRQKMIEIDFFHMPEPHPPYQFGETVTTMSPHTSTRLEATMGGQTRRLLWGSEGYVVPNEGDWKKLGELQTLIWRILRRQPCYRPLPPAKGGYL